MIHGDCDCFLKSGQVRRKTFHTDRNEINAAPAARLADNILPVPLPAQAQIAGHHDYPVGQPFPAAVSLGSGSVMTRNVSEKAMRPVTIAKALSRHLSLLAPMKQQRPHNNTNNHMVTRRVRKP